MTVVLGWTSHAAATESSAAVANQQPLKAPDAHVRSTSPRVMGIIIEAAAQSKTFRGLVDQIGTTDGFVYVAEGPCGHGVHACLLFTITMAGPHRVLWIHVDPNKPDRDLMASIGHELHALEVLSNRTIKSDRAMYMLYFLRCHGCGGAMETYAAIQAGRTVRGELQKSAAAGKRPE
jgi:hypothetical protein